MKNKIKDAFNEALNIELNPIQIEQFDTLISLLLETNKNINLTAITDPTEILYKHIIDSCLIFKTIELNKDENILDLGTGGGFPGIPILILHPDINMNFLDATLKKLNCVDYFLHSLSLNGNLIHSRAEDYAHNIKRTNLYDLVISRAVAGLNMLSELALPLVKTGGSFVSYKGPDFKSELDLAKNAIKVLGGKTNKTSSFDIDNLGKRNIIIIDKVFETDKKYPRSFGKIKKNPL